MESHDEAQEVLRINPKFSLGYIASLLAYRDQLDNEKYINALRKAGLK
jgi:hypothetical protein